MQTPNQPNGNNIGATLSAATQQQQPVQPQVQTQVPPVQPQQQYQVPPVNNQQQVPPTFNPNFNGGAQQPQQPGQPQQPQGDRSSRIYGANNRRPRMFTSTSYSENFKAAVDAVTEYTKKREGDGFNKSVFVFAVQDPALICSALVFTQCFETQGKGYALVYTMMLENTGGTLKDLVGNDPNTGEHYAMPNMPGSQYDDLYWRKVGEVVGGKLPGMAIVEAGATMVKSEMDWANEQSIARLLSTAENACVTQMNRQSGYQLEDPFNIRRDINPQVDRISANFNFNPTPYITADNNPVRNDVEIKLMASADSDMQRQGSEPIVITRGFVELLSAGPTQNVRYNEWGQMVRDSRTYYPQFVITNHENGIFDAQGPEFTALAIFTATLIIENSNWMNAFMPKMVTGVDFNDIGAINYDLKLNYDPTDPQARPQRINTKDHSFGAPQLQQLLAQACFPTMTIAMDIEETGINTWQDAMYLQAGGAPGSTVAQLSLDGQNAHRAIIESWDNMTDGAFSRHFQDPNKLITVRDGTRIPGGHYSASSTVRCDSRNIDQLAVLNLCGEQDPAVVEEFKMISTSTSGISVPKRVMLRNARLANLLGATYTQKCYYERVVITPEAVMALRAAVFEAGLVIRPENMNNQYAMNTWAAPVAAQYGVSTAMASSLVPGGFGHDQYGRAVNYAGFRTGPFGNFTG